MYVDEFAQLYQPNEGNLNKPIWPATWACWKCANNFKLLFCKATWCLGRKRGVLFTKKLKARKALMREAT